MRRQFQIQGLTVPSAIEALFAKKTLAEPTVPISAKSMAGPLTLGFPTFFLSVLVEQARTHPDVGVIKGTSAFWIENAFVPCQAEVNFSSGLTTLDCDPEDAISDPTAGWVGNTH